MSDPAEFLDETETRLTTISSENLTRQQREPNPEALSPRGRQILLSVAALMDEDYSPTEIAELSGHSVSWVNHRLTLLRSELALQTSFLPLSDSDYEALRESIEEHGVQTPVLLGEHLPIIDGRNRWNISTDLGLKEIPAVFVEGLSWEEEHDLSLTLNIARRQLGIAEKREVARAELLRDWARSDRKIAKVCGLHHETVGKIRLQLWAEKENPEIEEVEVTDEEVADFQARKEALDQLAITASKQASEQRSPKSKESKPKIPREEVEKRVGLDGKTRSVTMREPTPRSSGSHTTMTAPIRARVGYAGCPSCGSMLSVYVNGDEYTLEHERD